ncbi:MAG: hypothetical protein HY700_16980 [Gemmatimonadetes bacterium]|nr:hypothetical protein [Gemmatimonadota bacterium]
MRRLLIILTLTPTLLVAQNPDAVRDSARLLLFEQQFGIETVRDSIMLERHVVYWVEVTGGGTPVLQPMRRNGRAAFVVPIPDSAGGETRRFEVYPPRAAHGGRAC